MFRKRSFDKKIKEAIALGERNVALIDRLRPWCEHLQIKIYAQGILAAQTGLPIGMLGIDCPHAKQAGSKRKGQVEILNL
jgi:hypothetical protein